jgi:hypothetical protein
MATQPRPSARGAGRWSVSSRRGASSRRSRARHDRRPVSVCKAFLAHPFLHVAWRRGAALLAARSDQILKILNLRDSIAATTPRCETPILDDSALDVLDPVESRDPATSSLSATHCSIAVTSNRGPEETGSRPLPIP